MLVLPHASNPLPGRESLHFQGGHPGPGVELAADFPPTRQEDAAYVRIGGTVEPVPGAQGDSLWGFDVVVEDHRAAVIARLRDYYLGHWCSGSTPSDRIERFLRAAIGRTAGLSLTWNTAESLRLTPRALVAASTLLGGKETLQRSSANDANGKPNERSLMQTLGFPTSAQCRQPHEGHWVCLEGTPDANELRPGQSVVHAGRWLAINCDTSHCGTSPYRIDERDLEGRLLAVWHVRMPPEFLRPKGAPELLEMQLAGNTLKLKLGRIKSSTWDGKRMIWTYGDIMLANVELDRRLLLPAIPVAGSQAGIGATP